MTTTNIGYYARSAYGLYPYTAPLAITTLGIELYMFGKLTKALGIECNHARYNNGLLRILWEIASDGTTAQNYLASSSASVDKNVVNLKSDIIEQYWQTTGCIAEYFQFDCGAGLTMLMDTFALIATNLTNSAVINVYGYGGSGNDAPSDWSGVPLLTTIAMPNDPLEENVIYIAANQPTLAYRHFRVTIEDHTNPDGFIRIGRCVAGAALIFTTENCLDSVDYMKQNFKDERKLNGFAGIANNRSLKKTMGISFKNLNRLQYANYRRLTSYINYCRDTLKALVIIDPSDQYQFSVFAKLSKMPQEKHAYVANDTSLAVLDLQYDEGR